MKVLRILLFALAAIVITALFVGIDHLTHPDGIFYSILLFQAAGGVGVTTSYTMTYVPQYILWNDGGNAITSLKCTVLGEGVIHDSVTAQQALFPQIRMYGRVANVFTVPLTNGLIKNKNMTIDFTTSAVGAINVYGFSFEEGDAYVTCLQQTVLANSGTEFRKFAYLVIPAMGATDYVNIEFEDGTIQRFDQAELPSIAGFYQSLVTGQYIVDNVDARIRMLQLIPAANRTLAVFRYQKAS